MRAAAHDSGFARKMGISQSVAREFELADQKKQKGSYTRRVEKGMSRGK